MEALRQYIQKRFQLDEDSMIAFLELFTEVGYTKKSYFASQGAYPTKMAFVLSGILRAFYQNDRGQQYNKSFFKAGDFLGAYSSLLTGQKNLIDIQCLTPCTLLVADHKAFVKLYDTHPKIERIARITAEQFFIEKEKREIELVMLEAKERYKRLRDEYPELEQHIPQYHIASYLGITPTQLSRIRASS